MMDTVSTVSDDLHVHQVKPVRGDAMYQVQCLVLCYEVLIVYWR